MKNGFNIIICLALLNSLCKPAKTDTVAEPIDPNTAYELTRSFHEPPDKLFKAFIDPATLKKIWNVSSITVDARAGGKTVAALTIDNKIWDFNLTYKEVVQNKKLQWVVRFDSIPNKEITTTLLFKKTKIGTDLTLRQENFIDLDERDGNKKAWEQSLNLLEALISWH